MTGTNEENNFEDIWNETDDDGNLVTAAEESSDDTGVDDQVDDEVIEDNDAVDDEPVDDPTDDVEAEVVDYKALYEQSRADIKAMVGRVKAAEARAVQDAPPAQPQSAPEPSEEDKFLAKFREEYSDDVVRAIDIVAARRASQIADQYIATRVTPVEQQTLSMVEQAHFSAIEAAHPDVYDIDADPVFEAWIESRPTHVRGAYQYVREQGTPAEVISMLNEYKSTTAPKKTTPATTKSADAAMAVQRRRGTSQPAAEPDLQDEEALWATIPD